jgi:hypothetical protein
VDRIVTEMKVIRDASGAIINIGNWDFGHQDDDGVWANPLPEGAVEATADIIVGADGGLYEANLATAVVSYQAAIQNHVDQTAVSKQFNDGVTLASYANSTIAAWREQALTFVAWRDAVWAYAYGELAKVQGGIRPQPTVEAILAELPAIQWPEV